MLLRRLTAAAACCLVLAACTGDDGADDPPADPEQTSPAAGSGGQPPPLDELDSASDGAAVGVREQSFTVVDGRDAGPTDVVWAAVLENASATDLLTYVDVELTWSNAAGDSHVFEWDESPQQRSYDVPPGQTTVVGGATTVPFAPDALDVSIHAEQWYPMRDLDANGVPVGVSIVGYRIEVGDQVRVRAEYMSLYDEPHLGGDEDLRLLLVARDAAGDLLGAVTGTLDFAVPPPGQGDLTGSVRLSQWPAEADEQLSEVVIVKVCCSWVGES